METATACEARRRGGGDREHRTASAAASVLRLERPPGGVDGRRRSRRWRKPGPARQPGDLVEIAHRAATPQARGQSRGRTAAAEGAACRAAQTASGNRRRHHRRAFCDCFLAPRRPRLPRPSSQRWSGRNDVGARRIGSYAAAPHASGSNAADGLSAAAYSANSHLTGDGSAPASTTTVLGGNEPGRPAR
jgi:hypothetical protein